MGDSLVRVQVVGHGRRLDVCLPSRVPVWEFLPEVSRGLGGGDATVGLVTTTGELLDGAVDLDQQGVRHGDVLTVAPPSEHRAPVLHDDLVRAVHDRARAVVAGWTSEAARSAATLTACGAVAVALAVLTVVPRPPEESVAPLVVCVGALLLLARAVRRPGSPTWSRVAVGWTAVGSAWVAGDVLSVGLGVWGPYVSLATAGAVGLTLVATAGRTWPLYVPPVLVTTVWAATGVVSEALGLLSWQVAIAVLAAGTLVASLLPATVVELTVVRGRGEDPDGAEGIDLARLDADLVLAHRLVLAGSLTGTALTLSVAPLAVVAGPVPTVLVLLLVLLRVLRVRHQRALASWCAALVGAGCSTLAVLASIALLRPGWVPWAVVALALLAATLTVLVPDGDRPSSRRAWCADVVEVAVVVLLPVVTSLALWRPEGLGPDGLPW